MCSRGHEYLLKSAIEFRYVASITKFTIFPLGPMTTRLTNDDVISVSSPISRIIPGFTELFKH